MCVLQSAIIAFELNRRKKIHAGVGSSQIGLTKENMLSLVQLWEDNLVSNSEWFVNPSHFSHMFVAVKHMKAILFSSVLV